MSDLPTPKTKDEAARLRFTWLHAKTHIGCDDRPAHVDSIYREDLKAHARRLFPDPGEEAALPEISETYQSAGDPMVAHTIHWSEREAREWAAAHPGVRIFRATGWEEIPVAREPELPSATLKSGRHFRVDRGLLYALIPFTNDMWERVRVISVDEAADPALAPLLSTLGSSQ